jgi:hypothetical protein
MARQWQETLKAAILLLLLAVVQAGDIGTDSNSQLKNFCRRFEHRTAVVNNRLYIDGGFINSNPLDNDGTNYTSKDITVVADILSLTSSILQTLSSRMRTSWLPTKECLK